MEKVCYRLFLLKTLEVYFAWPYVVRIFCKIMNTRAVKSCIRLSFYILWQCQTALFPSPTYIKGPKLACKKADCHKERDDYFVESFWDWVWKQTYFLCLHICRVSSNSILEGNIQWVFDGIETHVVLVFFPLVWQGCNRQISKLNRIKYLVYTSILIFCTVCGITFQLIYYQTLLCIAAVLLCLWESRYI